MQDSTYIKPKKLINEFGHFYVHHNDRISRSMDTGHYDGELLKYTFGQLSRELFKKTAIDVGANIGTHTIPYARRFSRVISFEPQPDNYALLYQNIKANGLTNVSIHPIALYNKYKMYDLKQLDRSDMGSFRIVEEKGEYRAAMLDDFSFRDVGFIKIDVTGLELKVLEGARDTIKECKPVILIERYPYSETEDTLAYLFDTLKYERLYRINRNYLLSYESA